MEYDFYDILIVYCIISCLPRSYILYVYSLVDLSYDIILVYFRAYSTFYLSIRRVREFHREL